MMKIWAVKVAYYYSDEAPRDTLECDVKLCANKKAAIDELNRIIRDDWTSTIPDENSVDGEKLLADCRGAQEDPDSRKYSYWYYAKDGMLAWSIYTDGHGYKGEVVQLEVVK